MSTSRWLTGWQEAVGTASDQGEAQPQPQQLPRRFQSILEGLRGAMADFGYSSEDIFATQLALEEAIATAMEQAHGTDHSHEVQISYQVSPQEALVEIAGDGDGFEQSRLEGGSIARMRPFVSWLRSSESGNAVTFCKNRSSE